LTSFLLLWSLLYGLVSARDPELGNAKGLKSVSEANRLMALSDIPKRVGGQPNSPVVRVLDRAVRPTARIPAVVGPDAPTPPHVAGLGGTLFTDHLIAVEIAGAILFIALVGTAAIATPRAPIRPKPV
jgi:NADH-quinone oxidoreductase subunit J